jgi:hypothetical protein
MTVEQLTIEGVTPVPKREVGRPTKEQAQQRADVVREVVRAGKPGRRKQARAKADAAIASTARRVSESWMARAADLVLQFGRMAGSGGFIMEDARAYAYGMGLETPQEQRVWGCVTRLLSQRTSGPRIVRTGGTAIATSSNNSPKPLWKVIE